MAQTVSLGRWTSGAILALAGAHLVYAYLITTYSFDLPLMHFIAERAMAGDAPYRDLWDMNGPAIYQIHMALAALPGDDIRIQQGFAIAMAAVAIPAGWRLASGRGRAPLIGALAMAVYALWMSGNAISVMGQRDVVIATFTILALWLMLDGPPRAWRWAAAGLLIGYAVGIKPIAAPYALVALAACLALPATREERIRRALSLTAGGAAGGLVWLGWLAAIGALGDWWTIMANFNGASYVSIAREPIASLLAGPTVILALGAAAAAGVAALVRPQGAPPATANTAGYSRAELAVILAFLGCALAGYLLQGKGWPYQMAPVWLLASTLLGAALSQWSGVRPTTLAAILVGVVFFWTVAPALTWLHGPYYREFVSTRVRHVETMRAALADLPAGMKVQALDTTDGALQAMLETGRASASPVLYDFWLFEGSKDSQSRARKALLDGLEVAPSAILVTNQGWPNPHRAGFERLSDFQELDGMLHDHYKLVAEGTSGWNGEQLRFRLYRPAR